MQIDNEKLLTFAGASLAGAVSCATCWAWRALSARSLRRPWAHAAVHWSLGLVFGLGASLAAEWQWECDPVGKMLAGLTIGVVIGLFGPRWVVSVAVSAASEIQAYREYARNRRSRGSSSAVPNKSDSSDDTDTPDR